MSTKSKKYGSGQSRVGCKCTNNQKMYYLRNRYGAEIDIYPQDIDEMIEKMVIIRNSTRRMKR